MKWKKYTITTHIDAVDILSYELDSRGIEGIEIEDHLGLSDEDKEKMFVDIPPEPVEKDDIAKVSFYLEVSDDGDTPAGTSSQIVDTDGASDLSGLSADRIISIIKEILDDISTYTEIGEGTIEVSETEDIDWINNWKQYAKPFRASRRIAICPTWIEEVPKEILGPYETGDTTPDASRSVKLIYIDPGVAFGTGSHETTKLCIQALDNHINGGERVLDIGTGSGILSITSLLLGAGRATAIDIDELAVKAARENFDVNEIPTSLYDLTAGNVLADEKLRDSLTGYDIVVANILPDVIVPLTEHVPSFIKKGGIYITSGILAEREQEVTSALEQAGFSDITVTPMGEWVGIVSFYK